MSEQPSEALGKRSYYDSQGLHPQLVARYFRLLGDTRRVLDLGCGTGDLGRHKPREDIEVHGLDVDRNAIRAASRFEIARVWNLESKTFPFEAGYFDAAVAKDILEHVQQPWELVLELRRVIRPGGRLLVSVPMPRPDVVWADYTHVRGFTKSAIRGLLEDFGFDVLRLQKMGGIPLTGRLGLVDWIPTLLGIPGMNRLFGTSYEVLAARRDD